MNCSDILPWIRDYVDGEVSEVLEADVKGHCEVCESCFALVQAERDLKAVIRAKGKLGSAPPGLAERVSRAIHHESNVKRRPVFYRRRLQIAAGLFIVAVIGLGVLVQNLQSTARTVSMMAIQAVGEHQRRGGKRPDMEFSCVKRSEARDWFRKQRSLTFPIPKFDEKVLTIRGGRQTEIAGRAASMLFYKRIEQTLSLFVVEATPAEFQQMGLIDVAHMVCAIESFAGFKIICWKHQGLLYVLVVPGELNGIVDTIYQAYQS